MSKTIEEAAREASMQYCTKYAAHQEPYEVAYTEFLNGARHLMSLPLAQRLTAEEKERVKAIYDRKRYGTEYSKEVEYMEKQLLEHLLGKDFFKEGE